MVKAREAVISVIVCLQFLFIIQVKGQFQQDVRQVFKTCKEESQATEDDIAAFQTQQIPATTSGRCMLACMFNNSGLMQDGKYNVDGALQLTTNVYAGNPEKQEKAKQVIDRCAKEVESETDKCEIAAKIAQCTMNVSTEIGLL